MPEYLAPGVYVEETSFRPKTIEGVSTSTAGFVGPARFGPTAGEPPLLTSFSDFQRIYGGLEALNFDDEPPQTNYLAYAVRAFFEEGGQRCYVSRIYSGDGGIASVTRTDESDADTDLTLTARYPGEYGEVRVFFTLNTSGDVNAEAGEELTSVRVGDTVLIESGATTVDAGYADYVIEGGDLTLVYSDGSTSVASDLDASDVVHRVTVDVEVLYPSFPPGGGGVQYSGAREQLGTFTPRSESTESLPDYFEEEPVSDQVRYATPFFIDPMTDGSGNLQPGAYYLTQIFGSPPSDLSATTVTTVTLDGGSDGAVPSDYKGSDNEVSPSNGEHTGLGAFQDLDNVSIVAGPGYSDFLDGSEARSVQGSLIGHCERLQYRIAVLDTPKGESVSGVRDWRGKIDSTHAAMYYPWVTIFDPRTRSELNLPPSGHVAGIYARNDIENGVHKAPANEVVRSAVGFEKRINKAQQDVLNPDGLNCFRFFEGRGYRLWGARTATSDAEFKYVNIRRYLAYLERSIDEGTQVFVFENNGSDLWRNVRRTISSFLMNEWRSDRLMGTTPDEAFFVRCDRSTMTQNDIDNGRLICEIGVALFRPAEYVIFRIGQKLLSDTG